jgi:uncharacterized Zn-finger protein
MPYTTGGAQQSAAPACPGAAIGYCPGTAPEKTAMADRIVPHFHNDAGVELISIGAREFMCVGALPPFDHPHVFIDMGGETEAICPYCSTAYRFDPALAADESRPEDCVYRPAA